MKREENYWFVEIHFLYQRLTHRNMNSDTMNANDKEDNEK